MRRILASSAALALVACSATSDPAPVSLTIFAAASLRTALEEATVTYGGTTNVAFTLSFDASRALRTQIEQGAPADLFASADTRNPQALVDAGLADGDAVPFAGNRLTVIVPAGNPAAIESPADLARDGVRIIGAASEVPISQYSAEAVAKLASLSGYAPDFAARFEANVVSREDNVAAIRTKIELGEGDAAIVYVTDAISAGELVLEVPLPDGANVPATYAAVVVRASARRDQARAFLAWLSGGEGQAILGRHGFTAPP